jgi:hypothetical protein
MRNHFSRLATTVTLGAVCILAWTPQLSQGQIVIPTPPTLPQPPRLYRATDLGPAVDAGALNDEEGTAVTATFQVERFVNGVRRSRPIIRTLDDPCRDSLDLDTRSGVPTSINDSRIVVGFLGADAMEWFPANCPNSVQLGALPRLPGGFQSARAFGNNNSRDAVGSTTFFFAEGVNEVPTVWRKVNGGFTVAQLQTPFRPAPLSQLRQPGAARDINESGTIVGFTRVDAQTFTRAAIFFENQDPEILQQPTAAADLLFRLHSAEGISNNGHITGIASRRLPGGVRQNRGFIRTPDGTNIMAKIPNNGVFIGGEAYRINDDGWAVGTLFRNDGGTEAVLWNDDGRPALLTDNVENLPAGTVLTEAVDINNADTILAKGLVGGELRVFLLRRSIGVIYFLSDTDTF